MKRIFIGFFAIMAVCCLMVAQASAGTISQTGDTAFTVSSEAVEGTTDPLVVPIGDHITGYSPSAIPLGSLTDPVFNLTLSDTNAALIVVDATLAICSAIGGDSLDLIASFDTGSGTDSLIFSPSGSPSITNGVTYFLGTDGTEDCSDAAVAADLTLDVPDGTTSMSMTLSAGTAATQVIHDTAALAFLAVGPQYTGTVGTLANNEIDFETDFETLFGFTAPEVLTSDTIVVDLAFTAQDFGVNDATTADGADVLSCVVTPSDATPFDSFHIDADVSGSPPVAGDLVDVCVPDDVVTPTMWTCTWGAADITADDEYWIEGNIPGDTPVPELTIGLDCELAFGDPTEAEDRTVANGTPILEDANGGALVFRGTSVYAPLSRHNSDGTLETFFKFQSRDERATANQIRAIVLCDGTGPSITEVVTVGTISAGTPFQFTSTSLAALLSADCTVNSVSGYATILNITSDAGDLFGFATMVTPDGNQRREPLSTDQDYTQSDGLTGTISGSGVSN